MSNIVELNAFRKEKIAPHLYVINRIGTIGVSSPAQLQVALEHGVVFRPPESTAPLPFKKPDSLL